MPIVAVTTANEGEIVFSLRRKTRHKNSMFEASMFCPVREQYVFVDVKTTDEDEANRLFPEARIALLNESATYAFSKSKRLQADSKRLYKLVNKMKEILKP